MSDGTATNKRAKAGRKRIEMKRILKEESRQVCFSKRRNGLIKKANELCILCGSSVAIIAFSPGGKAFSYGHPSLDTVLDRFLGQDDHRVEPVQRLPPNPPPSGSTKRLQAIQESLMEDIAAMKRRRDLLQAEFQELHGRTRFGFFWDSDINELSPKQLEEFIGSMNELKSALEQRSKELMTNTCHDSSVTLSPVGGH